MVDTHFIYSAGLEYADTGITRLAKWQPALLAMAETGLACRVCRVAVAAAVFLFEQTGQNLILLAFITVRD